MRVVVSFLVRLLCLPAALLGLVLGLGLALVLRWRVSTGAGVFWVHLSERAGDLWRYSTTLGFVILLHPEASDDVRRHERVHVSQFEVLALATLLVLTGAGAWSGVWSVLWLSLGTWPVFYGVASLAAALSGGDAYYDNVFERHAYSETSGVTQDS